MIPRQLALLLVLLLSLLPAGAVTLEDEVEAFLQVPSVAGREEPAAASTTGSAALRQIDPAKLTRRVTFAWVVEEETGLVGSSALAERFTQLARVHPVDTFVSSDSPIETGRLGYAPLGKGAVLRAMDNLNQTPRPTE